MKGRDWPIKLTGVRSQIPLTLYGKNRFDPFNADSSGNTMRISIFRGIFSLILLSVNIAGHTGIVASADTLCPAASDRAGRSIQYGNLNKLITAPESKEEVREQFRLLDNPVKEQRYAAIMALALAGHTGLFDKLVAKRDKDGLFIYASHYLNSNGTRCLDPSIEKVLIQHHQQAWLQYSLQGFFPRNLYRSTELFKVLLSVDLPDNQLQNYQRYARALVSTNLPGIEAQILQKAVSLLEHTTPRQKNSLPAIHQAFSKYFARRHYTPAVDYMNRVRQPFNVNLLAQVAAMAALDDEAHVERTRQMVQEGKRYLYGELDRLGIEYVPSETNFFLINVGEGERVFHALLKKGVIVRNMAGYGLPQYIRITIGTQEENAIFLEALREGLGK